jgi:release factor glutamine methyltransferase
MESNSQAERAAIAATLRKAGCVAAEDEADRLVARAAGDDGLLADLVARRTRGEPLAWLIGWVTFCGETVRVDPGVYVPREQSEPLARAAAQRLPDDGLGIDLCTGSGALAVVLARRHPSARVLATEIDPVAAACARANGVEVVEGDLADGLPADVAGRADVVVSVVPYVPTHAMALLPRDVVTYEPRLALDGGSDGLDVAARAVAAAAALLRVGGSVLLEVGGDQDQGLAPVFARHGFTAVEARRDAEGDLRGVIATLG